MNTTSAQEAPKNSVYIEFAGSGLLYSINYERNVHPKIGLRLGAMTFWQKVKGGTYKGETSKIFIFPIVANHVFKYKNHGLEVGLGSSFIYTSIPKNAELSNDFFPFPARKGLEIRGTYALGYRYQRKEGGLIFRIGMYPLFTQKHYVSWPGLSLGYAF